MENPLNVQKKTETELGLLVQVGPGEGDFVLTVGEFNNALSTLGDSMSVNQWNTGNSGRKFSTK